MPVVTDRCVTSTEGEDGQDTSGYRHRCVGPTHKHILETSGRSLAVHGVSTEPHALTQPLRQKRSPPNPTSRAPERADERQSRGKRTCCPTRHSPSGRCKSKPQGDSTSHLSQGCHKTGSAGEDGEQLQPSCTVGGDGKGVASTGKRMDAPPNMENRTTLQSCDPADPFLVRIPQN